MTAQILTDEFRHSGRLKRRNEFSQQLFCVLLPRRTKQIRVDRLDAHRKLHHTDVILALSAAASRAAVNDLCTNVSPGTRRHAVASHFVLSGRGYVNLSPLSSGQFISLFFFALVISDMDVGPFSVIQPNPTH